MFVVVVFCGSETDPGERVDGMFTPINFWPGSIVVVMSK
jgi:hypothetical protein